MLIHPAHMLAQHICTPACAVHHCCPSLLGQARRWPPPDPLPPVPALSLPSSTAQHPPLCPPLGPAPAHAPAAVFSTAAVARRWKVEMLRIISTVL